MQPSHPVRYRVIRETLFHPDLGSYDSYAVLCEEAAGDDRWNVLQKIPDVTTGEAAVLELVARMNAGQLAPCHLANVIEDFVNS